MIPPDGRVEAFRSLASLLATARSPREAVREWTDALEKEGVEGAPRARALVAFGAEIGVSLDSLRPAFGSDLEEAILTIRLQRDRGIDGVSHLRALALRTERAALQQQAIDASAAGVKLSARLVAFLPLAFFPLSPAARAPLVDPLGLLLLVGGAGLALGGWCWIVRLEPRVAARDPWVASSEVVAGIARAGGCVPDALDVASRVVRGDGELQRAARRVKLGMAWSGSLARSGNPTARAIATVVERSSRQGSGAVDGLEDLAERSRQQRAAELERSLRRAPVKMVLPLVLCILPSFCLLALGPFFRALLNAR